jgi:membrane-bound ClpP family serine protease
MFIFGLVLVLMEIFVVPGFGIFGLGGGLMIIFSLVLASQTMIIPTDQAGMDQLRGSLATVAGAGVAMIALALATRQFLPKAPIFNRMVLEPPPPEDRINQSHREAMADYSYLVGAAGEATTDLRPAGKALIGDQLIDVIAEGMPIDRGARIVVVSAHAHRVVVRET